MNIFDTTALIPGSYDPPHKGHIAMIERAAKSGIADKFVVAAIKNPTKKRLLVPQNSVALLEMMLPDHLRGFVTIEDGSHSTLATARRHQADVVVRGRVETRKDALHEIALKYFFGLAGLSKKQPSVTIQRELPSSDPEAVAASSTKIKQLLSDNHHNNYFELVELMGVNAAQMMVEARDETFYPLSWERGRKDFNRNLARIISQRR